MTDHTHTYTFSQLVPPASELTEDDPGFARGRELMDAGGEIVRLEFSVDEDGAMVTTTEWVMPAGWEAS